MAGDSSLPSSSSFPPPPDYPAPPPPPARAAPEPPRLHFSSLDDLRQNIVDQAAAPDRPTHHADGTGRDFVFLPFSQEETTGGGKLDIMAQEMVDNKALRKLAVDLHQAGVPAAGAPHPQGNSWTDQTLLDQFNAAPRQLQDQLLKKAAEKHPVLIRYQPASAAPGPSSSSISTSSSSSSSHAPAPAPAPATTPSQPQPGPGDTVFIVGHGNHTRPNLYCGNQANDKLTPEQLITRMQEAGIPPGIGKINLQACGGRDKLQGAFMAACEAKQAYPGTQVIAYGDGTNTSLRHTSATFADLHKGTHQINPSDAQQRYNDLGAQIDEKDKAIRAINDQLKKTQSAAIGQMLSKQEAQTRRRAHLQAENDLKDQIQDLQKQQEALTLPGKDNKAKLTLRDTWKPTTPSAAAQERRPRIAEAEATPRLSADPASSSSSSSSLSTASSSSAEPEASTDLKAKRKSVKEDLPPPAVERSTSQTNLTLSSHKYG